MRSMPVEKENMSSRTVPSAATSNTRYISVDLNFLNELQPRFIMYLRQKGIPKRVIAVNNIQVEISTDPLSHIDFVSSLETILVSVYGLKIN